MPFSIGIVGLPNAGKSTLFQALTKKQVAISNYPFCTIEPNHGIVAVPDKRLQKISQIVKPLKTTPTIIEFVDIAGLVKNAHQGEGLGNQFLAHIREVDLILHLVRAFEEPNVSHPENLVDPKRDIEIVNTELALKDLETVEKKLEPVRKEAKAGILKAQEDLAALEIFKSSLVKGKGIRDVANLQPAAAQLVKDLCLLTAKPMVYILNINSEEQKNKYPANLILGSLGSVGQMLYLDSKIETEINELEPQELEELELQSHLDQIISSCYNTLGIITFYTITGGKEARAWTLKQGGATHQAATLVHSDFAEKFIKALVINFKEFVQAGSWHQAQKQGLVRTESKEYQVKDGDIIEFRI